MKLIVKPGFVRDIDRVHDKELKITLDSKITQIEKAKSTEHITGLKLLRTYQVHYRIKVETKKHKYRIGAIIRKETIWLVRFCPRKRIYLEFP
jgi:mRNA interferase RelE/StbE